MLKKKKLQYTVYTVHLCKYYTRALKKENWTAEDWTNVIWSFSEIHLHHIFAVNKFSFIDFNYIINKTLIAQ